jgi:diguanylate cyclase (GGDEF)-like protein/PAS domain S-box-containing protein
MQARFEQSHLPQAITGLDLRLEAVSEAMGRLLGRRADELIGVHVDCLTPPDAPSSQAHELLESGASGELDYERVYQRPDGTRVPVRVFASLVRDTDGAPLSISVYVVDLTDQQRAEDALRGREKFFQTLLERGSDVAVVNAPDGTVLYANATVSNFGYAPDEVVGRQGLDFVHPEDRKLVAEAFESIQRGPEKATSLVYRHHHVDGHFSWVEAWLCDKTADAEVAGIVTNLRDITARVESGRELEEGLELYRAIVETAREGIWVANPQGQTVYVNKKMADIVGLPIEDLYTRGVLDLLDCEDTALMRRRLFDRQSDGSEEYEVSVSHAAGTTRCLMVRSSPLWDAEGEYVGSLGMVSDITELKRVQQELRRQALYDQITQLPNRTLLEDRLEQARERLARGVCTSIALLMLDVDQFKLVNDSVGHAAGDRLLTQLGARLATAALPGETVARFGGDEFVVLSEDVSANEAQALAYRMLAAFDKPFDIDGRNVHVTASVGIATTGDCPPAELLQSADAAMYVAKRRGSGETQVFGRSLAAEARTRFELNVELREALCEESLELWYQPIVEIAGGRLLGIEALARWNHPVRGFVSPDVFVPIAEQSGLVTKLDRWVLRQAAADLAELRVGARISTDAYVSVNISAFHLSHGDLSASVSEASWLAGLSPRHMCLEVTETAVMAEPATASAALKRITDDGFSVALDDFGTGYSSLAYLRTLPVSRLKIDRCAAVQGSVGPFVVVVVGEGIELVLQAVQVAGRRSCAEPALEGLVQALDLALGLGVVRGAVLLRDALIEEFDLEGA